MILEVIPQQNFEIVRDALGFLIKSELDSQKEKENSRIFEDFEVFIERTIPIQNSEEVVINIVLRSGDFDNKTQKDSQGKTFFDIEFYTIGKSSPSQTGYFDSARKLHKYIGLIRYILQHTEYKTLNLQPGFIGGTMVENYNIAENQRTNQDTDFIKMGVISFSVRIQENQTMATPVNLGEIYTSLKIEQTEKGYSLQKK